MKRTQSYVDFNNKDVKKTCPVFDAANILGKKWMIGLMQEIALNGGQGFNFISKRMKIIRSRVLSKK